MSAEASSLLTCNYFEQGKCRSCGWIKRPYREQLKRKETKLKELLLPFGEFEFLSSHASNTEGFRNRAKLSVTGTSEAPILGLTGEDQLDQGREILSCPIHHPELNKVIRALPEYIREFNLIPYQIDSRQGELKAVILFYAESTQEMYLRFILRSRECEARIRKLLPKLEAQFPMLKCVSVNIQPVPHAILEGKEEIIVTDGQTIAYRLGSLELRLAPQAFVQTNSQIALSLYETAAQWIAPLQVKRFMELYSGQGAFSFFAAPFAKEAYGVEINPDAVRNANETAERLQLMHLQFICADARSSSVGNLISMHDPDLILVNPPRKGLTSSGVKLLLGSRAEKIIYSSCNAETLATDLMQLAVNFYITKVQIFDMFPHTEHFETLVNLIRKA